MIMIHPEDKLEFIKIAQEKDEKNIANTNAFRNATEKKQKNK